MNFYGLNSNSNNHVFFFLVARLLRVFFPPQMKLQENEEELEPDNKLSVEAC